MRACVDISKTVRTVALGLGSSTPHGLRGSHATSANCLRPCHLRALKMIECYCCFSSGRRSCCLEVATRSSTVQSNICPCFCKRTRERTAMTKLAGSGNSERFTNEQPRDRGRHSDPSSLVPCIASTRHETLHHAFRHHYTKVWI